MFLQTGPFELFSELGSVEFSRNTVIPLHALNMINLCGTMFVFTPVVVIGFIPTTVNGLRLAVIIERKLLKY